MLNQFLIGVPHRIDIPIQIAEPERVVKGGVKLDHLCGEKVDHFLSS